SYYTRNYSLTIQLLYYFYTLTIVFLNSITIHLLLSYYTLILVLLYNSYCLFIHLLVLLYSYYSLPIHLLYSLIHSPTIVLLYT
ncbi:hypothetical protein LDENG_00048310, partial [Lucifuga dentata]